MWQLEFLDGIGLLMPRRNDLRIAFLCPPATICLWLEAVSAFVDKELVPYEECGAVKKNENES